MKISKVILACVLACMVGNVFAASTKISCTLKSNNGSKKETILVEFNDNNRNSILVAGYEVKQNPYGNLGSFEGYDEGGRAKLIEFSSSKIEFLLKRDAIGMDGKYQRMFIHDKYYTIDREDGSIKLNYKLEGDSEISYGNCVKAEDIVKKF